MSLTSALNAARSGLTYSTRWAQTASSNISNANTPGYARRSIELTTTPMGDPIVSGVGRAVDASLDRMYRLEAARTGRQDALAQILAMHTDVLGDAQSGDSMLSRLTDFRNSLGLLSMSPGDGATQRAAVADAEALAGALNRAHGGLADAADAARAGVGRDIATINKTLTQVAELNRRIAREPEGTDMALAFADQMTQALDSLAPLIDVTIRTDAAGQVEIFAGGGAPLLQGREPALLSYDRATGTLTAGTAEITPGVAGLRGPGEGSLAGYVTFLNTEAPRLQAQLDEVARALIQGAQDIETATTGGATGLFTDAGAPLGAGFAPGLAGRIAVNDAVRPEAGGALWRIRDGMAAAAPGPAGDATAINGYIGILDAETAFDGGAGLGDRATLAGYMSTLIAAQQTTRAEAETARDTFSAGAETVQARRLGFMGVNVDDELQQLLQIEQAYAANSQVMRTVAEMMDRLLDSF